MGKSVLKVKGYEAREIKKLLKSNESYLVGMRLQVVYQVALGHSSRELASLNNVSFKQVTNWVHRFEKEGIEGLKDKKGRGRKALLNDKKMDRIKSLLMNESPENHGYKAKRWTGPLLTKWIEQEYGISYEKAQVYNLLNRLGFSFRKKLGLVYEKDNPIV